MDPIEALSFLFMLGSLELGRVSPHPLPLSSRIEFGEGPRVAA
jgi:hypothetical protein